MGSLDRRLKKLEGRTEPAAEDPRRAEINAELSRIEAHIRSLSPEELEAWRNSPEQVAVRRELEARIKRRRPGPPS